MSFQKYGITKAQAIQYLESLSCHIKHVIYAGITLNIDMDQLIAHDDSKLSQDEFHHSVRNYYGTKDDPAGYARAWLNHIHKNKHHHNHWRYTSGFNQQGDNCKNGCLPMPTKYIKEMVADWSGASFAYTGSYDMSSWLKSNLPKIQIHPDSKKELIEILKSMGYIINPHNFSFHGKHPTTNTKLPIKLDTESLKLRVTYLDWN